MPESLQEYYYSKCVPNDNFLASWQGLAYPSHVIQVVTFPIQILTFYVIIRHTPINMSNLKWSILTNHFWCTWLDFTICALSTPYVFLQYLGFLGVGVLSWLGVPYVYQLVLAITIAFFASGSYILLFESRSYSIQENRFKFTKLSNRIIYHLLLFLLDLPLFFMFLDVPTDQEAAKSQLLALDPCPTKEFFLPEVFIVTTHAQTIHFYIWVYIPLLLFHALSHVMFHASCTIYYIFIAPSKITSSYTRQCQRQFFIGMVFQTLIPVCFLAAPITYSITAFFTNNLGQEWMNLAVIISEFHGMGASIAILTVHSSYRNAIRRMLPIRKQSQVFSVLMFNEKLQK
uniref:Serpentine Receptor, class H n=1 Tax=Caenorhabditis tropicalis TaxID=1561998 RepID=A0A1I7U9I7_9PELO